MSSVTFRRATESDHQAVLSINKDIYQGYDYIHYNYPELIKDKRIYAYIGEENGKPITFVLCAVLNNETYLSGAGRTSEDAQGKGMKNQISNFAKEELKKLYPSLKRRIRLVVWNDYHENAEKEKYKQIIKHAWHFNLYATTKESVLKSRVLKNHEKTTEELNHTTAMVILKNPKNWGLFERVPLIAYHWWIPVFVNDSTQLEEYCMKNKLIASDVTPSFEVSALSSSMPVLSPNGIITSIFFHSAPSSDHLLFHHIRSHLEHLSSFAEDDSSPVSFNLHFPLDFDVSKVENFLRPDFGDPQYSLSKYSKVAMFEHDCN